MKKTEQNNASRREFLKKSGQAAIASGLAAAIGGCATDSNSKRDLQTSGAKASTPEPKASTSREAKTKKLRPIIPKGEGDTFQEFDGTRPPGWRPDTAGEIPEQYYFEEEAIALRPKLSDPSKRAWKYFRTPKSDKDFNEPGTKDDDGNISVPDTPANWVTFNSWILGGSLTRPTNANDIPFFEFVSQVAKGLRKYNAALYWLRRLHFAANDKYDSPALPRNPHGDKDEPDPEDPTKPKTPLKTNTKLQDYIEKAQQAWIKIVKEVNKLLDDNKDFKDIYADMVEVNGYVVSMRIVCTPTTKREVPGSSSSHISISSAFSSPGDDRGE